MEAKNISEAEINESVNALIKLSIYPDQYNQKDNYGNPKTDYLKKLVSMTDNELEDECESKIWLSAFASNNIKSDYHWHCDACHDECKRRDKSEIYKRAHKHISQNC